MTMDQQTGRLGTPAGWPLEPRAQYPWCSRCNTDDFLRYENFVPIRVDPDRTSAEEDTLIPANVQYTCSNCGASGGHEVPPTWSPPHWFWYS